MRFSVDSNILVYAFEPDAPANVPARRIMTAAFTQDCVLTNQVLGEFLKVCGVKHPQRRAEARQVAADWSITFPVMATTIEHMIAASRISERYRLQYWDSLILTVAHAAGAEMLLTEDMQDGATIDGVRLVNPFNPANAELLDLLLTPVP